MADWTELAQGIVKGLTGLGEGIVKRDYQTALDQLYSGATLRKKRLIDIERELMDANMEIAKRRNVLEDPNNSLSDVDREEYEKNMSHYKSQVEAKEVLKNSLTEDLFRTYSRLGQFEGGAERVNMLEKLYTSPQYQVTQMGDNVVAINPADMSIKQLYKVPLGFTSYTAQPISIAKVLYDENNEVIGAEVNHNFIDKYGNFKQKAGKFNADEYWAYIFSTNPAKLYEEQMKISQMYNIPYSSSKGIGGLYTKPPDVVTVLGEGFANLVKQYDPLILNYFLGKTTDEQNKQLQELFALIKQNTGWDDNKLYAMLNEYSNLPPDKREAYFTKLVSSIEYERYMKNQQKK